MAVVEFSVRGIPMTQGSKTAGVNRSTGYAFMKEAGKPEVVAGMGLPQP